MVADLRTLLPADAPAAPAVPVPQRILFAAIGWVPAAATVLAMIAAFAPGAPASGPAEQGAPAPAQQSASGRGPAEQNAAPGSSPVEQSSRAGQTAPVATAPPRPVTRTLLSGGGTGNYTGPPVTAAADVRMAVTYRVTCRSRLPYLTVSWEGAGPDFDYLTVTGALRMFGTGHLDPASTTGRFEVRTRDDCRWTVLVSQRS
jgi:hypothetical protein